MTLDYIYQPDRKLHLFCGIKGLIRDGDRLREELNTLKPERIYISISPEEVEGLRKFLEDPFEINLGDYEILYGVALSRYGEVMTPPPIFIEPLTYAGREKKEVVGLDFTEEEFSALYTNIVGPSDLIRHSLRKKSMGRKRFPYDSPEEFVIEWDRLMTRNRRMKKLENARFEQMMSVFMDDFRSSGQKENILVMEYEKCRECRDFLASNGFRPVS